MRPKCGPYIARNIQNLDNILSKHYPELLEEWHPTKNIQKFETMTRYSGRKCWWICRNCKSEFEQVIKKRTLRNQGCPYCSGIKVNYTNCVQNIIPEILKYWDYERNTIKPSELTIKSGKLIYWYCDICNQNYTQTMAEKYRYFFGPAISNGCPYCGKIKCYPEYSLASIFPELCKEWNYDKNTILPNNIHPHSGKKVYWKCVKNHEWQATVADRTCARRNGCPECSKRISKPEIEWLDFLNIPQIYRQRRIKLKNIFYIVDALDPINNIVYEFNGDFWHGNPNIFNQDDMNNATHTTFGELYNKTLKKQLDLELLGYTVISIWENEWNIIKKSANYTTYNKEI